ncbi:MAG: hypothetical protein WA326_01110, partial [Nitrososphaeraceae archaeon]
EQPWKSGCYFWFYFSQDPIRTIAKLIWISFFGNKRHIHIQFATCMQGSVNVFIRRLLSHWT